MKTLVSRRFSIDQCKKNKDTLFIYGCNMERYGEAGQAIIRNQENAIGFATKHKPGTNKEDYFNDDDFEKNCQIIEEEIIRINRYAEEKEFKNICFSYYGIGTGLAQLAIKAPKTFFYLCNKLLAEFSFNNVEAAYELKN